jgi:hypothetical protein
LRLAQGGWPTLTAADPVIACHQRVRTWRWICCLEIRRICARRSISVEETWRGGAVLGGGTLPATSHRQCARLERRNRQSATEHVHLDGDAHHRPAVRPHAATVRPRTVGGIRFLVAYLQVLVKSESHARGRARPRYRMGGVLDLLARGCFLHEEGARGLVARAGYQGGDRRASDPLDQLGRLPRSRRQLGSTPDTTMVWSPTVSMMVSAGSRPTCSRPSASNNL